MSTLLKMQKIHPLCSRYIGMYPLQNRWTVLRYLQYYENFSERCTHLILPETALFSPTPTFAKEPVFEAEAISVSSFRVFVVSIITDIPTAEKAVFRQQNRANPTFVQIYP